MAAYRIEFYFELTPDDFRRLTDKIRYYCNRKGVDFFSVLSSTDSKNAFRFPCHNGKRGRPKTIVYGSSVAPHVHAVIVGEKAHSAAVKICASVNKQAGRKVSSFVSLSSKEHLANFIRYAQRQADSTRSNNRRFFDRVKEASFF